MINKIINILEWQEIFCTKFWISKKGTIFKVLFHLTEFMCFQISKAEQKWLAVEKQYQALWNFPTSLGVIDGKHVELQWTRNSVSDYFNYQNTFSIVIFAFLDVN